MSVSSPLFSGYRQRRLQDLAARFSQAPAESWGGIDALPALFHEQLTLGTRFTMPLQATARFDPASATAAAEMLNSESRSAILTALDGDFEDAEYLTIWELIENASQSLSLLAPVTALNSEAVDISLRLGEEMARVPGVDASTPIKVLSKSIEIALQEWATQAVSCSPEESRMIFLGLLYRHVLSAFEAPENFWEIFLLKLELAIASPGVSPPLTRLLGPVFRVAWAALPIQPSLHAFWTIHSESTGADAIVAERITTLACLARAGGSESSVLRFAITPEWVASTPTSNAADLDVPWRATIVQHLELAAYQPLLEAADHWHLLVAASTEIPTALTSHLAGLRKISDDLSQGMAGKDISDLYVSLSTELLARGLWISTLTTNPAEARELYLKPAIRELGLDAGAPLWKKTSRLTSSLQQFISTFTSALPWSSLPPLLRALETRATDTITLPIRWSQPVPQEAFEGLPFAATDGSARCVRDVSHLLSRLVIERRIHGAQRGGMELAQWYAIHVLPYLAHLPDSAFRERWDVLAESGFSTREEHAHLNAAARRFGHALPRLTAARKLEIHAEDFATLITDEVMAMLPEYAEKVGPAGRLSCIRDNTLTLSQVANLLLSDTESPHEVLAEWWNSAVGSYLANRPARLFETNLAAIFHALNAKLTPSEVSAAFGPIQIVYRESLGIECLEALTGPPTAIVGPLGRQLTAGFSPPQPKRNPFDDKLSTILAEKNVTNPTTCQLLLSAFFTYHRELWTSGNADIATARAIPLFANTAITDHRAAAISAILVCVTDSSVASERDALLLSESGDGFVLALAQHGVATKLIEQAHEIAKAYSAAMVAHSPDHFKHLSTEDAIARCSRDQALLLRSLGERLARTAPGLFWIDSTRWFLELLSPFVQYPAHVWALSARTVAKHLGPQLSMVENIFLSRWVSHFEHLASGWSASHALAKKAFAPTDYSFSAHAEEDRLQRDLLAAALTARFAPPMGPWSGHALFNRFLLSWPGATRSSEEIESIIANITQVAGAAIPLGVSAWLERTPTLISALTSAEGSHPAGRYAHATGLPAALENSMALSLFLDDGPELDIWRYVCTTYQSGHDLALAAAAIRAHILHIHDLKDRAIGSKFAAAARARTGVVSASLDVTFKASVWTQLAEGFLPHTKFANTLRSHFTTLALEWPAVQAGLALSKAADTHSSGILTSLSTGIDVTYSQDAEECSSQTNLLAFAYAFRQAGFAVWDASTESPRLFFGYAADNHRLLTTPVAARAHTRVSGALRNLLPAGSALAGDAILGIEAPLFSAAGPLWSNVILDTRSVAPDYVSALFPAILPIAKDAAAFAFHEDADPRRAVFADRLCYHLEGLVCGLEETGDIESAWEYLLLRISSDLEQQSAHDLVSAFYGLTQDLSKHLPPGPAIFWRTCFLGTVEVVRQAALGHYMLKNSSRIAGIAAESITDDPDLRVRCVRDQEHLISLIGHLLATQAPVRAWLNFTSHLTEITLPHLSHSALELAAIWCCHERTISSDLDPVLRPALWTWFGALQRTSRNLPAVRPFVSQVVPALSTSLADEYGDNPADWRRFLSAIAASAATPDDGPSPGQALLEKALLSSPLGRNHPPKDWASLSKSIANQCETLLPGNMPNSLKRRLVAIPGIAARIDDLASGKGSRLVRACAAQSAHPFTRPLWQASLLARARPDDRLIESDPADAFVSSALGLPLESDEQILSTYTAVRASLSVASSLHLDRAKSRGFLSKMGLGKKTFDWVNDAELRSDGNTVLEILSLRAAISWPDPSYLWYWNSPRVLNALRPDKDEGILEFYQALALSATDHLGNHLVVSEIDSFASAVSAQLASLKLMMPETGMAGPLPLYLLGLREPTDIPVYAHIDSHSTDAITHAMEKAHTHGHPFNPNQAELVRRSHDEIGRHYPKN